MKKNKVANQDFDISMLPTTRKGVFLDIIKLRWKELLLIGLILLGSFLPLLALCFVRDLQISNLITTNESLSEVELTKSIHQTQLIYSLFLLPCFIILALFLSALIKVLKEIIWAEPLIFKLEFKQGIKNSFVHSVMAFIFIWLAFVIQQVATFLSGTNFYSIIILILFIAIISPPLVLTIYQSSIYKNNFAKSFKNAILLYIAKIPYLLLFDLLLVAPIILEFFTINIFLKYIILIFYIWLICPFTLLANEICHIYVFDECINKENFPEIYKKGMFSVESYQKLKE